MHILYDTILAYNDHLFFWLYGLAHRSSIFDWVIWFFGQYIDIWIIGGLAVLLVLRGVRHLMVHHPLIDWFLHAQFFRILSSGVIAWGLSLIIKLLVAAPRPYIVFPFVDPLIYTYTPYQSFPSGHTALFFSLAMAVWFRHKGFGALLFLIASIIALSRIVAGVHFPMDILGGAILGCLVSLLVLKGLREWVY